MTSVANIRQIVATIRTQLAGRAAKAGARPAGPASPGASTARAPTDLFAHVGERVRAIDRDDPDRGRKAFRIFLESVLVSELDESLVNDPQFYRLVDDIQRQMEADPQVAASIEAAIAHLLSKTEG